MVLLIDRNFARLSLILISICYMSSFAIGKSDLKNDLIENEI